MKVLIIGASGFIGFPVAQALLRAGHTVYGQTRSEDKVKTLASEEIIPVVGAADDSTPWIPLIGTLDAIIEATSGGDLKAQGVSILKAVTDAVAKHRPQHAAKLTYIYTSGTWVHGDNRKEFVSDTTPLTNPVPLVAWRPNFEQEVISQTTVNGIVVRPSLLYGRSASITGMLFKTAYDGQAAWYGKPGARGSFIHQDDLADFYVRVVERGLLVKGQIFDVSNSFTESYDDILQRLTEVSGAKKPYKFIEPTNPFEDALAAVVLVRPYLGQALLGWQPRREGFSDGIELFYNAWKASLGLQ